MSTSATSGRRRSAASTPAGPSAAVTTSWRSSVSSASSMSRASALSSTTRIRHGATPAWRPPASSETVVRATGSRIVNTLPCPAPALRASTRPP